MARWAILPIVLFATAGQALADGVPMLCNITRIYDGGILYAVCSGRERKVRFCCIDAPR